MTSRNSLKHKIKKVVDNFINMFSFEERINDEQIECMQFGICDYAQKQVEEIPYFHF